jgi:hypothetical protein
VSTRVTAAADFVTKDGIAVTTAARVLQVSRQAWPAPCFRSGLIGSQSGVVQVQVSAYSVGVL